MNDLRDAAIRAQYENGMSLRAVGHGHGLTHERVRQILERDGVPVRAAHFHHFTPEQEATRIARSKKARWPSRENTEEQAS